ncbi:proteasome assembly chaperone 1-like isoform 2 [Cricetulus griseus]|uniref:Proteasome assembly chaperone 1 n=1 Tax=Cricetulus griseus TaxID=10029 RepID=A0A061I6S6_CRIGR|nr:proteasome assembly chaperone 1-like isoform 2 [Cricetulus griseus]
MDMHSSKFARVLSYCQVWRIPAVLYLCYTDVMKLDLVTVEAFKPVLSSSSLECLVKVRWQYSPLDS